MLEALTPPPPDKIIELMDLYRADDRRDKVDLGVGVYKDAGGNTPILRAVKEAEQRLWRDQSTKSYVGLAGDLDFVAALRRLIFGDAVPEARIAGVQTPGGTGAVRQLFELVARANPEAVVWHSDPTWPNHPAILNHLGAQIRTYRYFDAASRGVDFEGMLADLAVLRSGDVVLIHGCCHNPTGADLSFEQWRVLSELLNRRGAVPMIDLAYQGFGDGLEADVAGLRYMAAQVPEMLVAASCSKNFGLYRERVGAAFAMVAGPKQTGVVQGNLATLNRLNYSFPPDHGAKLVEMILADVGLRTEWTAELEGMRLHVLRLRRALADALRRETNSDRFDFLTTHRGMFSRLGADPEQVAALRRDHGIYMVGDSRINIAGLPEGRIDRLAAAIAAVGV